MRCGIKLLIFVGIQVVICGGCACVDQNSLSYLWQQKNYPAINAAMSLRCASARAQDEEEFQLITEILLEADSSKLNQLVTLQNFADIAFSYCEPESDVQGLRSRRLREYEAVIIELLSQSKAPRSSTCLLWLYVNQQYSTKRIVDAVFDVAFKAKNIEVRQHAITFLAAFFGFVHSGFCFTDDSLPGGIKTFPLQLVYRYWNENFEKVMKHRAHLEQYARMGYYDDAEVVSTETLPAQTYDPPQDMGLSVEQFPDIHGLLGSDLTIENSDALAEFASGLGVTHPRAGVKRQIRPPWALRVRPNNRE